MGLSQVVRNLERCDELIESLMHAANIPGAALAAVAGGELVFSRAYGVRDLQNRLPMTPQTIYPIASTTKAINATLIGMLVDEGKLEWNTPVQRYLTSFRLRDPLTSAQVTLTDLISMRTGLPRHDWMWIYNPITRAELVEQLPHLDLSAGLRERFQYSNLPVIAAGYVAETVAGASWESLVQTRILEPLGMSMTGFGPPKDGEETQSYHEGPQRELLPTHRYDTTRMSPSGGSIHSTIEDMARWAAFNLRGGVVNGKSLIQASTLQHLHSPWTVVGSAPESISPHCAYGGGWFVDIYHGRRRISHGGFLHDVHSDVALFPQDDVALVCCTNFGFPRFARFINECVFSSINELSPTQTLADQLAQNDHKRANNSALRDAARRVCGTSPSHPIEQYAGTYEAPGYGTFRIGFNNNELVLERNRLLLSLEHWHYDVWFAEKSDFMPALEPHPFDRANRITFETSRDGAVSAMAIRLEPSIGPIRFEKR